MDQSVRNRSMYSVKRRSKGGGLEGDGSVLRLAMLTATLTWALTGTSAWAQNTGIGAFVPNTNLSFAAVDAAGEPTVRWPNGEYQESNIDLRVKVLGGTLDIARTWSQGRWWLNPAWAPLNFELDPLGDEAKIIERAGVLYERSGQSGLYIAKTKGSAAVYIKQLKDAQNQPQGWQWYDRFGNTISYDNDGRILGYANPSGVKVSFAYDSASTARLLDHFDKTIYTVTMSGGLITKVVDLAGRSVSYQWKGNRLTQVIDVMGHAWNYEYDTNGQITSRTDPLGDKATAQYSISVPAPAPMLTLGAKGMVLNPAGPSGTTQKLANLWGGGRVGLFDGKGCSVTGKNTYIKEKRQFNVTYTDCRGNVTLYIYDLQGNELSSTFNGKPRAQNSWDGNYVQKQTNARGYSTTTQYDSNYQPLQITYPDGSVEKYTYEPRFGYKSSHTNQLGVVSTWSYDSKGHVTEWIEAKGLPEQRATLYQYDPYGQLISTTRGAGDGRQDDAVTQRYEYDDAGNVTVQVDGEGHARKTVYDQRGAPTSRTDALNRTTTFNFDAAGNLTKTTNPLGHATQMRYDARNRRTHVISPMGNTQVTRYDIKGRVIEMLAPGEIEGAGRRTVYDSNGWPIQSISPSGLITETTYDERGRVKSRKDPAGNVIGYEYGADGTEHAGQLIATHYPTYKETYKYDQQGRQTAVTQHLENNQTRVQSQTFDALDQRVASTDPAGRTALSQYDVLGRVIQNTDPAGNITKQGWNALDQLISVTDANGNTHHFHYDKTGQLTREVRPMGGVVQYSYDIDGQLVRRTDAGDNTRSYKYNAAGHMFAEEHKLKGTLTDQKISYSYDADSQLIEYEQKDGGGGLISSASYTRDGHGRSTQSLITYGKVDGTGSFSFTIGQEFNADGQLASHIYPDGSKGTYIYEQGQLANVVLPDQRIISYGSYQWGTPTQIKTPGGIKSLVLDALQRPLSIEVRNSMELLARRYYKYDQVGNITQIDSDLGRIRYVYDILGRLINAYPDQGLQNVGVPVEQYSYDALHNRMSSIHQPGVWKYNEDNQLTNYPYLKPFTAGVPPLETKVAFTPQGHTSQEINIQEERRYVYNAAERLSEFESIGVGKISTDIAVQYRYDPMGRRISKDVKHAQSKRGTTTYFIYADTSLLGEMDGMGVLNKAYGFNPISAQQGLWSTDPIWQADLKAAQGQSVSLADNAMVMYHYLHTDHLQTPLIATNQDGQMTWSSVSESFGATKVFMNSGVEMNLRYPGQYFDVESNSNYNYRRNYRFDFGRYLQSDPLSITAGMNFYAYAFSNAILNFDDSGLCTVVMKFQETTKPKSTSEPRIVWQGNIEVPHWNWRGSANLEPPKKTGSIGDLCFTPFKKIYRVTVKEVMTAYIFVIESKMCYRCEDCGRTTVTCDPFWSYFGERPGWTSFSNLVDREYVGMIQTWDAEICLPKPPFTLRK